ncbi:hypothetical protein D3C85_507630 [compost metagenome]
MGGSAEGSRLHRQNGEDAGHEVEDQAAEQGEQSRLSEGVQVGGVSCRRLVAGQGAGAGRAGQGGAGRGRNLPGAQVGGEDAGDRSFQGAGGIASGGDGHGQALGSALAGLDGGVVENPALKGVEVGPSRRGARQRSAGRGQGQSAVGDPGTGLDAGGAGGGLNHRQDGRAVARVQGGGALLNPEVQREVEVFGHAHLVAADEEMGDCFQLQRLAGASVGGDVDGNRQEDGVGIAVVHQALQALTLGQGPDDLAGLNPGRQGPVQGGGAAGIPLIAPIGVPAGLNLLAYGDDGGRAGRGPGAHRDQFGLDPLRALRPREGRRRARPQGVVQSGRRGDGRGGEDQPDEKGGEKTQGTAPDEGERRSDLNRRVRSQPPSRDGGTL